MRPARGKRQPESGESHVHVQRPRHLRRLAARRQDRARRLHRPARPRGDREPDARRLRRGRHRHAARHAHDPVGDRRDRRCGGRRQARLRAPPGRRFRLRLARARRRGGRDHRADDQRCGGRAAPGGLRQVSAARRAQLGPLPRHGPVRARDERLPARRQRDDARHRHGGDAQRARRARRHPRRARHRRRLRRPLRPLHRAVERRACRPVPRRRRRRPHPCGGALQGARQDRQLLLHDRQAGRGDAGARLPHVLDRHRSGAAAQRREGGDRRGARGGRAAGSKSY